MNRSILDLRDEVRHRMDTEEQLRATNVELQLRAEQLSRLTSELTLVEQRERQRLGQVLHDHLQQLLVGAKFGLSLLAHRVGSNSDQSVGQIEELPDECIKVSRSLAVELYPPILHLAGLAAGLEWLGGWMHEKHGLKVDLLLDHRIAPDREDVRILLFQSVRELLLNVVKHANVTHARVKMTRSGRHRLRIVVSDEGSGFDTGKPGDYSGSAPEGFGLNTIRERVAFLGGRLEIDSSPGNGTRCTLVAPLQKLLQIHPSRPAAAGGAPTARPAAARRRTGVRDIRLVLADDHMVMREGLARLLNEFEGIEVVGEAADGEEALQIARRLRPDVILMDLNMPRLNGVEATRILHEELPQIRIIGLSMHDEQDRARAMYAAGATAYFTKTGNPNALLDQIYACAGGPSGRPASKMSGSRRKTARRPRRSRN